MATLYAYITNLTDQLSPFIAQGLYQAVTTYAREAPRNLDILNAIRVFERRTPKVGEAMEDCRYDINFQENLGAM